MVCCYCCQLLMTVGNQLINYDCMSYVHTSNDASNIAVQCSLTADQYLSSIEVHSIVHVILLSEYAPCFMFLHMCLTL
jgi:hypothetical protein